VIDRTATWDLAALTVEVARALSELGYAGTESGRVRDVPDARVIRYYTTLGLLDRPAELRGRTAYYSARHLAQLVAIKRLQARGQSLAEVQAVLAGIDDTELLRIARDDLKSATAGAPSQGASATLPSRRARPFWKQAPAPPAASTRAPLAALEPLVALKLDEGVTLLLSAKRELGASQIEAIAAASAPLLSLLQSLGLAGGATNAPEETGGEDESD